VSGEDRIRLREEELAFFGTIGADVSHDMRNILAIVKENAGLLGDLVAGAGNGRPLDRAKLKEIAGRIEAQVGRGAEAMRRLSRFSHATDEPVLAIDLVELAATVAAMLERRVATSGCRIELDLPGEAVPVRTAAFALQFALASAILLVAESLDKGGVIMMKVTARGDEVSVSVSTDVSSAAAWADGLPRLSVMMNELKGRIDTSLENGTASLTMAIPK
jgi:signal transduction histidine kinase